MGRAKLWAGMGGRCSPTGIEQNAPGTNVLNWSENKFKILLGRKFRIKLPQMYHRGRWLAVFCCAGQANKCSHFLLTTVTCTRLENIFLPSSFSSQAFAFLFYLHYKTGSKPSPKSSVTEMESKEMPDCWWGLWLTGIAGSWNVQRQSKGAQVFQMESEGSRGLSSALWNTLQIFQLVKYKVTLSEINYFIIQL